MSLPSLVFSYCMCSVGAGLLYSVRLLTVVEFGLVAEQAVPSVLSLLSSIWLPKLAKSQPSTLSLLCEGGPQPLLLALKWALVH